MVIPEYKTVVLGGGGVGKSAFTIQFIQPGNFIAKYDPTIEDVYRKQFQVGDNQYMVEVLDTAGQEGFMAMRDFYLKGGQAFILMFSVVSKASLYEIHNLPDQIKLIKGTPNIPMIIVGNKCDLQDREVSTQDGEEFAKKNNCLYLETSAKERINVDEVFKSLVTKLDIINGVKRKQKKHKPCTII